MPAYLPAPYDTHLLTFLPTRFEGFLNVKKLKLWIDEIIGKSSK